MLRVVVVLVGLWAGGAAADWTPADTTRQAVYFALHAADWLQTRDIAVNPEFEEVNVILGRHPTTREVDRYFAATAVLHYAVARTLPARYRPAFQYFTIGVQAGAVSHNYRAGVSFRW